MKTLALIAAVALVALIGWRFAAPNRTNKSNETYPSYSLPTTTQTDPAAVFQKAFWKRPSSADEILHAERREWKDADNISRWQWFIKVKPSPELTRHLITNNAFNLSATPAPAPVEDAPAWFDATGKTAQVLQSPGAHMQIIFDPESNLLLATDTGGGFTKGAPVPVKPIAQSAMTASRLPNSPPPKP